MNPLALAEEASEGEEEDEEEVALRRTEVGIGFWATESSMERVGARWRYKA